MKNTSFYINWIFQNKNPLILITLLIVLYTSISLFYQQQKINPRFFKIVVDEKYHIIKRSKGPDFLKMKYQFLFDTEKYKEYFFFDLDYPKDNSRTMRRLLQLVEVGDTLTVGVDKTEFAAIQNYGSNFIKDDFFDRRLKAYFLYRGQNALIFTTKNNLTNANKEFKNSILIVILITVTYVVLKNTAFVKYFT